MMRAVGVLPHECAQRLRCLPSGAWVMSMRTMSGLMRLNSAMAVRPVSSLAGDDAAKDFDHLHNVLAREDGVVHHKVADLLLVLAKVEARNCGINISFYSGAPSGPRS